MNNYLHKYGHCAPPTWGSESSKSDDKNSQDTGYISDYTGAFITDWEIPLDPTGPGEDPSIDFIVDWTN